MDRRLRPDDTFISTRPSVGGKKVRRKKGVAPRKKKSAFKKRPAKSGKIVFDTATARRARLQALSTAQLLQGAENIGANEIGRQDRGFFAGRQQAPIQVNLGAAQQVDDRVAEAQRRMNIANLVNPAAPPQPRPQDFRDAIREALRENQGDLERAEEAAGVGDIPQPRERPIFRPPPQEEPDFGEVDEFAARLGEDIGVEPFEAAEQRGQIEPEVAFEGTGGEAADIIAQATTPLFGSEESEEALSAFNFPVGADAASLGFTPQPSEIGGLSREGFDPTFDDKSESLRSEIELRTPTPSETSELPPILPTKNPAFEEESARIQRGRLEPIKRFVSRSGSRAAQLFSRSGGAEPEQEGAVFISPFDESSIVGGNDPSSGRLTINPFEATGGVIGSRAVPNPAGSLYESEAGSIGFEVAAD